MEDLTLYHKRRSEDPDKLCQIFPEEVWGLVFDAITDPEDVERCYHASPFFQRLLQRKRVQIYFPKVFRNLEKLIYKNEVARAPHLQFLDQDEGDKAAGKVLKLRQVCKSWKDGIDQYYESCQLTIRSPLETGYGLYVTEEFGSILSNENNRHRHCIPPFIAHYQDTHHGTSDCNARSNPFIARTVSFYFETPDFDTVLKDVEKYVTALLTGYGHHIHICRFYFCILTESYSYERLLHWLSLMVNLKSIELSFSPVPSFPPEQLAQLSSHITSTDAVPHLKHLQYFRARNLLPVIFNQFIRKNSHVSEINIKSKTPEDYNDMFSVALPKLIHLRMEMQEDLFTRIQHAQFSASFYKLQLNFKSTEPPHPDIFLALGNKWRDSLTDLRLLFRHQGKDPKDRPKIKKGCLRLQKKFLPKVTRLDVVLTRPRSDIRRGRCEFSDLFVIL